MRPDAAEPGPGRAGPAGLRPAGVEAKPRAMTTPHPAMAPVRAEIDRLDRELVALLVARAACIDRAIAVKAAERLPARITPRVEEVVANVREAAAESGLDGALVEALWRQIIEWSIAREERALGPEDSK